MNVKTNLAPRRVSPGAVATDWPAGDGAAKANRKLFPLGANINGISDRAAMGLPDHFIAHREWFDPVYARSISALSGAALAELVEHPALSLEHRLTAAFLLGLDGDPRLSAEAPAMITIEAGHWMIGLAVSELPAVCAEVRFLEVLPEWIEKETPRHGVDLAAFRIGKYPVTNGEYRRFLADSQWPELPTSWTCGRYPVERSNHPVYSVTPAAADAYAAWLAARTGRAFRLPTEAEWEVAAGAGRNRYPWGDVFEAERCNTLELGLWQTTPVGCFPSGRAACGAFDMGGNVEEIVADEYRPYAGGPQVLDDLAVAGPYRMTRGGCFSRFYDLTRCQRRHGWIDRPIYALGFRLAEDLR